MLQTKKSENTQQLLYHKTKNKQAGKTNVYISHLPAFLSILALSGQFLPLPTSRKPAFFMRPIKSHTCDFQDPKG